MQHLRCAENHCRLNRRPPVVLNRLVGNRLADTLASWVLQKTVFVRPLCVILFEDDRIREALPLSLARCPDPETGPAVDRRVLLPWGDSPMLSASA